MTKKIGVIGLGRVGLVVVETYLNTGYQVYGYDIDKSKIDKLIDLGGKPLNNPSQVWDHTNTVLMLVLNDEQVVDVIQGEQGLLTNPRPNGTIVGMSTINRNCVEQVASKCDEHQVNFVDCPFTGGPARVPQGDLTLITAGLPTTLEVVKEDLAVIGKMVVAGDKPGYGQAIKHCNQLLVGVTHAATMEVITLARKLDLDVETVREVLSSGIAGSDYFGLLSKSVLEGTPSPGGLGQMCKDVSIVAKTATEQKVAALVAAAAAQYFGKAEHLKMQHLEGADLMEVVENWPFAKDHL